MNKIVIYNEENLSVKPATRFIKLLAVSIVMNLMLVFALVLENEPDVVTKVQIIKEVKLDTIRIGKAADIQLNDSSILRELIRLECVLPNVALAQFKIESQHYKSAICRENKNIAGIKNSASPLVIGKNRDHCVYKSYRDCIKDYVRVQNKYLKNIDGHYAAAGGYVDLIKRM